MSAAWPTAASHALDGKRSHTLRWLGCSLAACAVVLVVAGGASSQGGLGGRLTGLDAVGSGQFGASVALSADGTTALVGARNDAGGIGAAWLFGREGSDWIQLGAKLTGSKSAGQEHFGSAVALSGDGKTALVGSPDDNYGTAQVYVRSGSTWSEQGATLRGSNQIGKRGFGSAVALSANGSTAIVGGAGDDAKKGAAWVFSRSGSIWSPQSGKLTGKGTNGDEQVGAAQFGFSVALAAGGNTALVGGLNDDGGKGAAWVFTRSGSTWSQQGSKLTGAGEAGSGYFGSSVALSAGGDTALIGGLADGDERGGAWVFARSGSIWSQQGSKLTGGGAAGKSLFGTSAALSADGTRASIGGPGDDSGTGAVWVFARSGSAWRQTGGKLFAGEAGASVGASTAVSGDGRTALVGAPYADGLKGAAWVSATAAPSVVALSPASGPAGGGTVVQVSGSGFTAATSVWFGKAESPLFAVASDGAIRAVAPPGKVGPVEVRVTSPAGVSSARAGTVFTYVGTPVAVSAAGKPVARIVRATVSGHGAKRTLRIRIRVSKPAWARFQLVVAGRTRLLASRPVKRGVNDLQATVPAAVVKGVAELRITLILPSGSFSRNRSTVLVPS